MWHSWRRREVFTWFRMGGQRGRPRRRWDDNIKMDLREIGIDGAKWIRLARYRVQWRTFVNTVMNLRVSQSRIFFDKLSDNQLFK
jgi:hypothetical protein